MGVPRMSAIGTVSLWIKQLKGGDRATVQKLWESYFHRLVGLARKKLQGCPRGAADEEDVVLSAFDSFCRGAEEGRFPQLLDRDDLWHLLVLITSRKAINRAKQERRQKRGGGAVWHESALPGTDSSGWGPAFANVIGREPDPEFAVLLAEEYRRLLEKLTSAELRSVAVWKLEGYTNEEIAARLGRSRGTVERKLRLIRDCWEKEVGP
jgi:DNA-directed RNA polymerase specialized sigma24 family protein